MANTTVIEIPLDEKTLNLLNAKAQEYGQPVEQLTKSIIDRWAERQQINPQYIQAPTSGQPLEKLVKSITDNQITHDNKMSLSEFLAAARKLSVRIGQRVGETSDSVEILREIREERSNQ